MWHNFAGNITINSDYTPSTAKWTYTPLYNYPISLSKVVSITTSIQINGHLVQTSYYNITNTGYNVYVYDLAQALTNVPVHIFSYILGKWR